MERHAHQRIEGIYFTIFFSLLVINTLSRTTHEGLKTLADITIDSSLILMAFLLIVSWFAHKKREVRLEELYITYLVLVGIFLINYAMTQLVDGSDLWRTILLSLFVLGSIRVPWGKKHIKIAGHVFGIAILFYFVHWLVSGLPLFAYQSIYTNENYLAAVLFSMFFFIILAIKYSHYLERMYFTFVLVCNLILLFSASARSVLIGVCVILVAIWTMKYREKLFLQLIYIIIGGIFLFITFYIYLKGTWLGNQLNDLSRSLFHKKNLFSGRSDIWRNAWDAITDQPLFGYGFGIQAQDVSDATQGAHNLYLQILLEGGIVGLLAFGIFLVFIWRALCRRLGVFVARWSAFFLLGILVYNSMEVTLHPHNYTIAMFQWIIITMGINVASRRKAFSYRMERHLRPFQ